MDKYFRLIGKLIELENDLEHAKMWSKDDVSNLKTEIKQVKADIITAYYELTQSDAIIINKVAELENERRNREKNIDQNIGY